jgi:hypothetical protein
MRLTRQDGTLGSADDEQLERVFGRCLDCVSLYSWLFYNLSAELLYSKNVSTLRGSLLQVRQGFPIASGDKHCILPCSHLHISRRGKTIGFCCGALARR